MEGMHSVLQRAFTDRRKALNPGIAIEEKKLLDFSAYKDIHTALKKELHGEKGTM